MRVVVVESPAKAKSVGRYLGRGCRVLACYGHVSDLPSKAGSVRPDDNFAMTYETAGRRAARALGSIRAALAEADGLFLATDPDREGEAIAWQVLVWLEERGAVGDRAVHRVAFHEVTPEAVRRAMAEPRGIDMDLVRAWQARRALDYLVGYGLSPLLWRKLPGCRSAGRVQSVALRLVCEREAEIDAFAPRAYWTVGAEVAAGGDAAFGAALRRLDGAEIGEAGLAAERMARDAAARIARARFRVASVTRDTLRRAPPPPFTTSTLQQEAARRLGFGIGETMDIAQRLYEGVDLGGETAGLITYMRTDSTAMAKSAVAQARATVRRDFGEDCMSARPRLFRTGERQDGGAWFAQEAHEAIRPTDFARTAEALEGRLGRAAAALYGLIRKRALASQMAAARFERVGAEIAAEAGDLVLAASGTALVFDGHLRVWGEDGDGARYGAGLPALESEAPVTVGAVRAERHVTVAPPRYTEAGLVRRLDALGIGRPSTWAAILAVLREREYVLLHDRRFVPTERGRVVTAFLEGQFGRWVEYGFTAGMEADLDCIAGGRLAWREMLKGFWGPFHAALEEAGALERTAVLRAVEGRLERFLFGAGARRRHCPACGAEALELRLSRYGPFVGCARFPPAATGAGSPRRRGRTAIRGRARSGPSRARALPSRCGAVPTAGTCSAARPAGTASPSGCRCPRRRCPMRSTSPSPGACWRCRARSGGIPRPASRSGPGSGATAPGCGTGRPTRRYRPARTCWRSVSTGRWRWSRTRRSARAAPGGRSRSCASWGPIRPTVRRCGSRPAITAPSSRTAGVTPRCRRRSPATGSPWRRQSNCWSADDGPQCGEGVAGRGRVVNDN